MSRMDMKVGKKYTDFISSVGISLATCTLAVSVAKSMTSYYFFFLIASLIFILVGVTIFDYYTYEARIALLKTKRYEHYMAVRKSTFVADTLRSSHDYEERHGGLRRLALFNAKAKRTIDKWGLIQDVIVANPKTTAERIVFKARGNFAALLHDDLEVEKSVLSRKAVNLLLSAKESGRKSSRIAEGFIYQAKTKVNERTKRLRNVDLFTCASNNVASFFNDGLFPTSVGVACGAECSDKNRYSSMAGDLISSAKGNVRTLLSEGMQRGNVRTLFSDGMQRAACRAKYKLSHVGLTSHTENPLPRDRSHTENPVPRDYSTHTEDLLSRDHSTHTESPLPHDYSTHTENPVPGDHTTHTEDHLQRDRTTQNLSSMWENLQKEGTKAETFPDRFFALAKENAPCLVGEMQRRALQQKEKISSKADAFINTVKKKTPFLSEGGDVHNFKVQGEVTTLTVRRQNEEAGTLSTDVDDRTDTTSVLVPRRSTDVEDRTDTTSVLVRRRKKPKECTSNENSVNMEGGGDNKFEEEFVRPC